MFIWMPTLSPFKVKSKRSSPKMAPSPTPQLDQSTARQKDSCSSQLWSSSQGKFNVSPRSFYRLTLATWGTVA